MGKEYDCALGHVDQMGQWNKLPLRFPVYRRRTVKRLCNRIDALNRMYYLHMGMERDKVSERDAVISRLTAEINALKADRCGS